MYATLNDSYQWNQLNTNNAITKRVQDLLAKGDRVTLDRIPTTILQFRNKIKSPVSSQIIDFVNDGRIILIYSPDIKVPVYMPFLITQSNPGVFTGVIFLNTLDAERPSESAGSTPEIFMNARKFKVAAESCYASLCLREMGDSPKTRSTTIIRAGSKIYSAMLSECLNRKHSIKLDVNIHNSIKYIFSRYYISTMIGAGESMDKETMRNYCLFNCANADIVEMDRIVSQFNIEDFKDISTLFNKIKIIPQFEKRMGKLTLSNFLESYINMYNASALLGLEVFNYFMYNVFSVNEATYVNNYQVLKNIVGDDGKKLHADIMVAISNLH